MSDVAGLSVLLVEDEYLIALDAEELLKELGVKAVETVATFESAEKHAEAAAFDIAVLDVNINGRKSFPIAQTIQKRGIPVMFASGYELQDRGIPGLDDVVCITKPYTGERLKAGLSAALARHVRKRQGANRTA